MDLNINKERADTMLGVGLILVLIGFFSAFVGAVQPNSSLVSLGFFLCIIGIPTLVIGLAMGGTLEETKRVEKFSTHVNTPVITKEKEVIVKEVVMIPCEYCGGLMPQTATFCPHCGAKRKT